MKSFDLKELLQCFFQLTRVSIAAYDAKRRCIYNMIDSIAYCSRLHRSSKCLNCCIASDDEAFRVVRQTGEPYFYTCPFGLYEAILPVRSGEEIVGYLFLGATVECDVVRDDEELLRIAISKCKDLDVEALREAAKELEHCERADRERLIKTATVFLHYIEQNCLSSFRSESISRGVCSYIKKHLDQKITLRKLSKELHCCTVTLTEHFRKEMGVSIMQYVAAERAKRAMRLLAESDLSISEVAEACGYQDAEYFSKCFRRQTDTTPSAWRAAKKKEETDRAKM